MRHFLFNMQRVACGVKKHNNEERNLLTVIIIIMHSTNYIFICILFCLIF